MLNGTTSKDGRAYPLDVVLPDDRVRDSKSKSNSIPPHFISPDDPGSQILSLANMDTSGLTRHQAPQQTLCVATKLSSVSSLCGDYKRNIHTHRSSSQAVQILVPGLEHLVSRQHPSAWCQHCSSTCGAECLSNFCVGTVSSTKGPSKQHEVGPTWKCAARYNEPVLVSLRLISQRPHDTCCTDRNQLKCARHQYVTAREKNCLRRCGFLNGGIFIIGRCPSCARLDFGEAIQRTCKSEVQTSLLYLLSIRYVLKVLVRSKESSPGGSRPEHSNGRSYYKLTLPCA
jgi:hypothetical protein